jgi:hypothetical protein
VTSRFGWIDFAEDDRQQMLDILKLFALRDTRDELGIGTVRDAFANFFFPGTTTIQTRARYFLIVPWVFQEATRRGSPKKWSAARLAQEVDYLERSTIGALKQGGETDGVIGGRAGRQVERLPSSVYWPGMAALNIRRFPGSQSDLTRWLSRSFRRDRDDLNLHASEMDSEAEEQPEVVWHGSLPAPPDRLFGECTLALTAAEAEFLRERIRFSHPHSLFATFLEADSHPLDQGFVWEHPLVHQLEGGIEQAVEDARRFSLLIHGAAYLYNLMLAEKWRDLFGEDRDARVTEYENALLEWSEEVSAEWSDLRSWCDTPEQFWGSPGLREWRSVPATRTFVTRWFALLAGCDSPIDVIDLGGARSLIRDREYFLKHANRARLHNTDALRRWSGSAGTGQLDFRWGTARTIVRDIWDGIDGGEES